MTRRTRTGLAALGAATLVVLAGCESEDDPPATPTPSPTTSSASPFPSPTATPSPSPSSSIPAAAREKSEAGAKAFARFYIGLSGRAWTVPDPELLEGHSTAKCKTCDNLQDVAEQLARDQQRYTSSPITVTSVERFSGDGDQWVFEMDLRQNAVKVVDRGGKTVKSQESRILGRAIALVWQEDQWLVDGISE